MNIFVLKKCSDWETAGIKSKKVILVELWLVKSPPISEKAADSGYRVFHVQMGKFNN